MEPITSMALVAVPAGRVTLTDRRTETTWTVAVEDCRFSAHPITRGQYAAVTGERPAGDGGHDLPVTEVSWWDALRFCNLLSEREGRAPAYRLTGDAPTAEPGADGYRLPSEAEWEHACRAGTTGPRYGELDAIAWYRGNAGDGPREVGRKAPNEWGLHDMLGNVWEWVFDLYDPSVYGTYRVLRGGGWFDEHWSCRASVRRRTMDDLRIDDLGFRVVAPGATSAA